jgi:hypothetical protein
VERQGATRTISSLLVLETLKMVINGTRRCALSIASNQRRARRKNFRESSKTSITQSVERQNGKEFNLIQFFSICLASRAFSPLGMIKNDKRVNGERGFGEENDVFQCKLH